MKTYDEFLAEAKGGRYSGKNRKRPSGDYTNSVVDAGSGATSYFGWFAKERKRREREGYVPIKNKGGHGGTRKNRITLPSLPPEKK